MATTTTNLELYKPEYTDVADVDVFYNPNMDTIDAAITARKTKQTAVTDPTASGNATSFIDSISQNANGEITATKKTVPTMTGATSGAAGAAGLVPAPASSEREKYLRGDGTYATPPNTTYTFTNKAATLAWGTSKTVATVGGVDITVGLPANPNTNTWRGYQIKTYTADYSQVKAGNSYTLSFSGSVSGYTKVGVIDFDSGSDHMIPYKVSPTQMKLWCNANLVSGTATIKVLYLQNG